MDFPHGNCQILIDKSLAEENIDFDFDKGKLISKKSNLPIYGLLKAQIIPSYKYQPFFPYRFKNKIYYPYCKKCLENESQSSCKHGDSERAFIISTTVDTMNFALDNGFIESITLLEVWSFETASPIFRKFVSLLIQYKENALKNDVQAGKLIKNALQCSFGKLATKPNIDKNSNCHNFRELNEFLLRDKIKVTNITPINDKILTVTYDNQGPWKNSCGSVILGTTITWGGRCLLQKKLIEINEKIPNCKVLMTNTDSAVLTIPKEYNLADKIAFSNRNGHWKHQINCKEILSFYCLNPVCYHLSFIDENEKLSQINKIAGFKLDSLLAPKLRAEDFDHLLMTKLFNQKSNIRMLQFKKSQKSTPQKTVFTLRNNLSKGRFLKNDIFDTLAYGFK